MEIGVYSRSRSVSGWADAATRLGLWIGWGALLLYLVGLACYLAAVIPFPYSIHYDDGPLINAAVRLLRGVGLYPENAAPPYSATLYTPLHYVPFAWALGLFGTNLTTVRLVSLFTTMLVALLVHRWVHWKTGSLGAAFLAAGVLLTFFPVANWAASARADSLAVLFSLGGAYMVDRFHDRRAVWLAVPLFALAFYTKQTYLAGPAAAVLFLMLISPRRAVGFAGLYVASVAIPFAILDTLTGNGMFRHIVDYGMAQPQWPWRGKQMLKSYLLTYAGYLAIAVAGVLALRLRGRTPILGLYLAISLAATVTVISDGSDFNHYMETATVTAVLVGVGFGRILDSGIPWVRLMASAVLALQLATRVPSVVPDLYAPWTTPFEASGRGAGIEEPPLWLATPTQRVHDSGERLASALATTDGDVWVELSAFESLAGRIVQLDDPYIFAALARSNRWSQEQFLQRLRNREFGLIALLVDVRPPGFHHTRLTDEMVAEIRSNYRLDETLAYPVLEGPAIYIYRPVNGKP